MAYNWKLDDKAKHCEAILTRSYVDPDGVIRWKSNNAVPFDDCLEDAGVPVETRKKCDVARSRDAAEVIEAYRKAQARRTPEEIAEEKAEMRAAFGPGVEVVNVFTGERTKL